MLGPLSFKSRAFLAKQVSQDFMHSFLGLIHPLFEPPVPAQGYYTHLLHCFRLKSDGGSKSAKRLGDSYRWNEDSGYNKAEGEGLLSLLHNPLSPSLMAPP